MLHQSSVIVSDGRSFPLAQDVPLSGTLLSFIRTRVCLKVKKKKSKYSSWIKRAPLASGPMADLTGPVRYRSSSVACQVDWSCSPSHPSARHLPAPTIQRKFEPWHSWTHKGALKSGPAFSWRKKKKYVWVIEVEIWPPRASKRSESTDAAILTVKTAQFRFHKGLIEGFFSFLFQVRSREKQCWNKTVG